MKHTKEFEEIVKEFSDAINAWRWHGKRGDELNKAYAADRKDLRKVLSLFRRDNSVGRLAAFQAAERLDTIVRDVIPDRVWAIIA